MLQTFDELGIDLRGRSGANIKTHCPQCSHTRKKPKEPCMSVDTEKGLYHCFNCGWKGIAKVDGMQEPSLRRPKVYRKPDWPGGANGHAEMLTWFHHRGISPETVGTFRVQPAMKFMPTLDRQVLCAAFPYLRDGELVNVKYRGIEEKAFCQEKDAEKILFWPGEWPWAPEQLVICEGEIDAMSFHQAGIPAASIPDGAIAEGVQGTDTKFEYLFNCEAALAGVTKIILALDNDGPGRATANELARRLGEDRCWRVEWPSTVKDANDILVAYGEEELKSLIERARPWPIYGVIEPMDVIDEVLALRHNPKKIGVTTGWVTLDPFFKILMPEVTIIGGTPSHGKSNFINNLARNLIEVHHYPVAMFSFEEGKPPEHFARLTSKFTKKAYWPAKGERQSDSEVIDAMQRMQGNLFLVKSEFGDRTLTQVLERAGTLVRRHGVRVVFIDPWNHLNHTRVAGMSETEEVSHAMSQLRDFVEQYDAHVFLCAHPAKPASVKVGDDLTQQVPHPYQTSGSAHFFNKTDNFLTIYRDVSAGEHDAKRVSVYAQKVRTQRVGKVGMVELRFDDNSECLYDLASWESGGTR